jgi:hypothetical protein
MNDYPPGCYLRDVMSGLPDPGPDVPPQAVDIDARSRWGLYRVTFIVRRNSEQEAQPYWFWAAASGKRL